MTNFTRQKVTTSDFIELKVWKMQQSILFLMYFLCVIRPNLIGWQKYE